MQVNYLEFRINNIVVGLGKGINNVPNDLLGDAEITDEIIKTPLAVFWQKELDKFTQEQRAIVEIVSDSTNFGLAVFEYGKITVLADHVIVAEAVFRRVSNDNPGRPSSPDGHV